MFEGGLTVWFPVTFQQEERTMVEGRRAPSRQTVTLEELRATLRELLPSLEREYGVTSIELFGSYVRGEQDEKSDLDVLVEFVPDGGPSLFGFVGLQQELSDRLGIRVDLVEKKSIKPRLRDRILHEAVPL
jgi:predicted nucleotidyltransferase